MGHNLARAANYITPLGTANVSIHLFSSPDNLSRGNKLLTNELLMSISKIAVGTLMERILKGCR